MSNTITYFEPKEIAAAQEIKIADKFINLVKQGKNPYSKEPLIPNIELVSNKSFTGINDVNLLFAATENNIKNLAGTFGANLEFSKLNLKNNAIPVPLFAVYQDKIDCQNFYFFDQLSDESRMLDVSKVSTRPELLKKQIISNFASYNQIHNSYRFERKLENYKDNQNKKFVKNRISTEKENLLSICYTKDNKINSAIDTFFTAVEEYKKCQITNKKSKFLINQQKNIEDACSFLVKKMEEGRVGKNLFSKVILNANEFSEKTMLKDFSKTRDLLVTQDMPQKAAIIIRNEVPLKMANPEKVIVKSRSNQTEGRS